MSYDWGFYIFCAPQIDIIGDLIQMLLPEYIVMIVYIKKGETQKSYQKTSLTICVW